MNPPARYALKLSSIKEGTDTSARFGYQLSIAADPSGNIYVIDAANARIRKITQ